MQRDRDRDGSGNGKKFGDREGRGRVLSYHGDQLVRPDVAAKQSAAAKQYLAKAEAFFEKKQPEALGTLAQVIPVGAGLPRVVETATSAAAVPPSNKRQDMLRKITNAQGSKAVSDAVEAFLNAGFTLPDDQEIFLQVLEHRDEARVREAISQLDRLLAGQTPRRKPVLVQRLKRIEENADEAATRDAATALRNRVA